jgi:hypothetical protein
MRALAVPREMQIAHQEYSTSYAYAGSFRPFVALACQLCHTGFSTGPYTFQVKKNVGLVVLEHLSYELRVHVLDIDLLEIFV